MDVPPPNYLRENVCKCVKMEMALHRAVRAYAKREGLFVNEVHQQAIRWYLEHQPLGAGRYLMSPRKGRQVSLWLSRALGRRVSHVAELDDTTQARVIYTSIVLFMERVDTNRPPTAPLDTIYEIV